MKVLYFLTHVTNSGGMEHIVIDKINYLANHGYYVSLAYFGTYDDDSFFPIDEKVKRIPIIQKKDIKSFRGKLVLAFGLVTKLKEIIRIVNPDVIVNANANTISWILPFIQRNIPKIVELHFSYDGLRLMNKELYSNNKVKAFANNMIRSFFYPLYSKCILLTEIDKKKWGFKNGFVIPNFTSLRVYKRSNLGTKRAICVGRLDYVKNIDLLIESWKIVTDRYPDWHLDVWGNGPLKDELQEKINRLKLAENVKLCGVTNNLANIYPDYSLFVLPSRYEGFPLVLVEAMNFGLPCIGFDISGNVAVIQDRKNGIIVKERTKEKLADSICELLSSNKMLELYSKNAVASVQKFEKENVMQMWMKLFKTIVYENCN